jgi:hypothetical protein
MGPGQAWPAYDADMHHTVQHKPDGLSGAGVKHIHCQLHAHLLVRGSTRPLVVSLWAEAMWSALFTSAMAFREAHLMMVSLRFRARLGLRRAC